MPRFGDFVGYLLRGVKYIQAYAHACVYDYTSRFVYRVDQLYFRYGFREAKKTLPTKVIQYKELQ